MMLKPRMVEPRVYENVLKFNVQIEAAEEQLRNTELGTRGHGIFLNTRRGKRHTEWARENRRWLEAVSTSNPTTRV